MHLTDEQLQRAAHGEELSPAVRDHMTECLTCREKIGKAALEETEIFELLRTVDLEPPQLTAESVAALAASRAPRTPGRFRWAAVILLVCILGGVAYALPGSPLKSWLQAILAPDRSPSTGVDVAPGPAEPQEVARSGIAVDPGDRLTIVLEAPPLGGRARVMLTDDVQVIVRAPAGRAGFTAGTERLVVSLTGDSTEVEIRVPQGAPRVDILSGSRRLWSKSGTRIEAPYSPNPDTSYLLPLIP